VNPHFRPQYYYVPPRDFLAVLGREREGRRDGDGQGLLAFRSSRPLRFLATALAGPQGGHPGDCRLGGRGGGRRKFCRFTIVT